MQLPNEHLQDIVAQIEQQAPPFTGRVTIGGDGEIRVGPLSCGTYRFSNFLYGAWEWSLCGETGEFDEGLVDCEGGEGTAEMAGAIVRVASRSVLPVCPACRASIQTCVRWYKTTQWCELHDGAGKLDSRYGTEPEDESSEAGQVFCLECNAPREDLRYHGGAVVRKESLKP